MSRFSRRRFLEGSLALLAARRLYPSVVPAAGGTFAAAPYVQLGPASHSDERQSVTVMWHAHAADTEWDMLYRRKGETKWRQAGHALRRIAAAGVQPHQVYTASLSDLTAGEPVRYRLLKKGAPVFQSQARARKDQETPYRFAVFGDCGAASAAQRKIAFRAHAAEPDFVVITGDVVYRSGRISEYRNHYFPVFNADAADPLVGAPLSRSVPIVAVPGNHDVRGGRSLSHTPDGLAYFLYFSQPLNGPAAPPVHHGAPRGAGANLDERAFLEGAGPNYPRMANFSFDYGNSHWTALDANPYVDWREPALQAWLENDLRRAQDAVWRFVTFHHSGFNSGVAHFSEQQMRRLAPLFEHYQVDVVWSGHVHNYQRTAPMRFDPESGGRVDVPVDGKLMVDQAHDGRAETRARGVVYVVNGAGGAGLNDPERHNQPSTWQPFTRRLISDTHSLSVADVCGRRLTVRQLAADGAELDRFVLTK